LAIKHSLYLRYFSVDDLTQVYNLACQALSERYDPTLFMTISSSWPEGFIVVGSPSGIKAFILGVTTSPMSARILMFAVCPEMRGMGIGTILMGRFLEECRKKGIRVVSLEVRKSNNAAIRFYYKAGFQSVDVIRHYYNDGEDAYLMQMFL